MKQAILSTDALRDLAEIRDYIAEVNRLAAINFLGRLYDVFSSLATFPRMGRLKPKFGRGVRTFPCGSYIIYYEPLGDSVEIRRVLHARRDQRKAFRKPSEGT